MFVVSCRWLNDFMISYHGWFMPAYTVCSTCVGGVSYFKRLSLFVLQKEQETKASSERRSALFEPRASSSNTRKH